MALSIRLPIPRFVSAGEIFFEKGSIGVLRGIGASRIAVIASRSLLKCEPLKKAVLKALGPTDYLIFEKPSGEPRLDQLGPLIQQVSDFRPDWIVAIGGGSVLDAAKLVWTFYEHPDLDMERACRPWGLPRLRGKARFVAIPTTVGTGSEVSSAAVFLDPQSGAKRYFVSHELLPDIAILDPEMTTHTPRGALAASAMDALSHAIEGSVSIYANAFLDAQAEQAVAMIFQNMEKSLNHPNDLTSRSELMMAAMMAGWVQNLKLPGIAHALAHQLGSFGVPHGSACGILLGHAIRFNADQEPSRLKYARLAERIGRHNADDLADACDQLLLSCGLPKKLGDVGKDGAEPIWAQREQIVQGALQDVCAKANPRPLNVDLVMSVLKAAL